MTGLARHGEHRGRLLDGSLHLLDRTVEDSGGVPFGVVDDLELAIRPGAPPVVTHLIVTAGAFAQLRRGRAPVRNIDRLPWRLVTDLDAAIGVDVHRDDLNVTRGERWLREHVFAHLPGGRHAPE